MSQPPEPNTPPATPRRITAGGVALIVIGLVILIPSGLCTASMGIVSLGSMFSAPGGLTSAIAGLFMTIALGGPFVALGALLIRTGLRERKPK